MGTTALNIHNAGSNEVQWQFTKSGAGTFTAAVEYTLDDLFDADVSAAWVNEATPTAASAATMSHPATGIRLSITAASGNNQIGFRVLQPGT
jgi:hypothetical protein